MRQNLREKRPYLDPPAVPIPTPDSSLPTPSFRDKSLVRIGTAGTLAGREPRHPQFCGAGERQTRSRFAPAIHSATLNPVVLLWTSPHPKATPRCLLYFRFGIRSSMPDSQQQYYDVVAAELAQKILKPGIWARAMAEAGTDDARAQAYYIRLRVAELKEEEIPPPSPDVVAGKVRKKPMGVGGWLTFFCIGLTMLGPLWSLIQMFSSYNQALPSFIQFPVLKDAFVIECVFTCFVTVYGFSVGWRILGGSTAGRRLAIRYLKVRLWGSLISQAFVLFLLNDLSARIFDQMISGTFGIAIREIIYCLVWWTYFHKSKRVRNTYHDA